ncbi:LysE family translocator [Campylobacter sp.]|uniref:LysE family translocator n=1 Tax=Campylobacter sp. TaxID=205 RepID=UPI00270B3C0E|nr:LysE family translocator [Campylobacter sp.]
MELINYASEFSALILIVFVITISPGPDFIITVRNSMMHGRSAGIYSAIGIATSIWIHVGYSIAGLALIISQSITLFSIIKYFGAGYLIYIGYKTFTSKSLSNLDINEAGIAKMSKFDAFKMGFVSNVLNPKTTILFFSIFTQLISADTSLAVQIAFGALISLVHLAWFAVVGCLFSTEILVSKFYKFKKSIERLMGALLVGFGLKIVFVKD